jgi:hypothetical protein
MWETQKLGTHKSNERAHLFGLRRLGLGGVPARQVWQALKIKHSCPVIPAGSHNVWEKRISSRKARKETEKSGTRAKLTAIGGMHAHGDHAAIADWAALPAHTHRVSKKSLCLCLSSPCILLNLCLLSLTDTSLPRLTFNTVMSEESILGCRQM